MFQSHRLTFASVDWTPSEWKPEAVTLKLVVAWPHVTFPNPTINSFGHSFLFFSETSKFCAECIYFFLGKATLKGRSLSVDRKMLIENVQLVLLPESFWMSSVSTGQEVTTIKAFSVILTPAWYQIAFL